MKQYFVKYRNTQLLNRVEMYLKMYNIKHTVRDDAYHCAKCYYLDADDHAFLKRCLL